MRVTGRMIFRTDKEWRVGLTGLNIRADTKRG